jgi:HNH endonuclease
MELYPNLKKVLGPYLRKDGRKHVILYFNDGSKRTVSYPKWLVENHIKRRLNDNETVDHFDRDYTNDNIDNLRIKTRSKHAEEDANRVKLVEITCIRCGKKAFKQGRDLDHNARNGKAGPFCGRSCAGSHNKEVQLGLINHEPRPINPFPREYYQLNKAT